MRFSNVERPVMMVINNVKVAIVVHCDKVQFFCEGQKNLHNLPDGLEVYYSRVLNKRSPTIINYLSFFQGLRPYSGLHSIR